jgi:uncharacterized protein (DUF58 family)
MVDPLVERIWHHVSVPPPKQTRLGNYARYAWRQKVSPTGRATVWTLLVAALGASMLGLYGSVYVFVLYLMGFLLAGRLAQLLLRPRVSVHRQMPERCAADTTLELEAEVENTSGLPVFDLTVTERTPPLGTDPDPDPLYIECLRPGERTRLRYQLSISERGVYRFRGPAALSCYPFGIYHSAREFHDGAELLVYPRFRPLASIDLPVGRRHQPGGLQLVSRTGDSEEFIGNREYRPGDRLRDLDHRAWARVGSPVVREYRQEYLCRIALVLDTFVQSGLAEWGLPTFDPFYRRRTKDFEGAVSLAAAVADCLSRQEYVIDLFAAGPQLYHLQAGRSLAYLDNILDVLACIEPCRRDPFARLTPAILEEVKEISTAVVLVLDWDARREAFVRALADRGVEVKLLVIRGEEPTLDVTAFRSAAGPAKRITPDQVEAGVGRL